MAKKKFNDSDPAWPYPEVLTGRSGPWVVGATETSVETIQAAAGIGAIPDKAGATDVNAKILVAPVAQEICGRCGIDHRRSVRNHELVHAQWSPTDADRVRVGGLGIGARSVFEEVAEEVRVNHLLQALDLNGDLTCRVADLDPNGEADAESEPWSVFDWASNLVGSIGTKIHKSLWASWKKEKGVWEASLNYQVDQVKAYERKVRRDHDDFSHASAIAYCPECQLRLDSAGENLDRLEEILNSYEAVDKSVEIAREAAANLPTTGNPNDWKDGPQGYKWTMDLADRLKIHFPKPPKKSGNRGGGGGKPAGGQGASRHGTPCVASSVPKGVGTVLKEGKPASGEKDGHIPSMARGDWLGTIPPLTGNNSKIWGEPRLIQPPRTIPTTIPEWVVFRRPVEEGSIMAYPHRWAVDKGVFGRRRRVKKEAVPMGSVLIDVSGSMCWNVAQLTELIQTIPAGTVAIYSGCNGTGAITVIAAEGKRVDLKNYPLETYGGNVIDGPALEWLGNQPKPRVWLSDGAAWGIDSYSASYRDDAQKRANRIGAKRLRTVPETIKYLEEEKEKGHTR